MRTVIIDDERLARKELASMLKGYEEIEIIGECSNADEAIEFINMHKPELIFLDIEMPEKNGFEVIKQIDKNTNVVFVTAYNDYALKAFEVNATDYLLKPVDPERLKESMSKLLQEETVVDETFKERTILRSEDRVFIKDGEKCWFIKVDDIRMFESEGNYIKVYFDKFRPLILKSLNSLEEKLDPATFFRANRKYIVNLRYIKHIESWFNGGLQVTLDDANETRIEISRRQAVKFKALMSL
jgi:two-component system, LytTR family, response regulator